MPSTKIPSEIELAKFTLPSMEEIPLELCTTPPRKRKLSSTIDSLLDSEVAGKNNLPPPPSNMSGVGQFFKSPNNLPPPPSSLIGNLPPPPASLSPNNLPPPPASLIGNLPPPPATLIPIAQTTDDERPSPKPRLNRTTSTPKISAMFKQPSNLSQLSQNKDDSAVDLHTLISPRYKQQQQQKQAEQKKAAQLLPPNLLAPTKKRAESSFVPSTQEAGPLFAISYRSDPIGSLNEYAHDASGFYYQKIIRNIFINIFNVFSFTFTIKGSCS